MKSISIITISLSLILIVGCSSFTKMRYRNGFKSNFECNFIKRTENNEVYKAAKAIKKQNIPKKPDFTNTTKVNGKFIESSELVLSNNIVINSLRIDPKIRTIISTHNISKYKSHDPKNEKLVFNNHRPLEPTARKAGILFYGGIAIVIALAIIGSAPMGFADGILFAIFAVIASIFALIMIISGFFKANNSIKIIRETGGVYSGMLLSKSIKIIFLSLLFGIALMFALIILFP